MLPKYLAHAIPVFSSILAQQILAFQEQGECRIGVQLLISHLGSHIMQHIKHHYSCGSHAETSILASRIAPGNPASCFSRVHIGLMSSKFMGIAVECAHGQLEELCRCLARQSVRFDSCLQEQRK